MLKGISPLISPELIYNLMRMGHGDELVLADAHFPGESLNKNIIRADGLKIAALLDAILPLFNLDDYVSSPAILMAPVDGDTVNKQLEENYTIAIKKHYGHFKGFQKLNRYDFYDQSKQAFAIVMTGETEKYGNIIIKKGVTTL
jgi:L-fucose mutarotase